jgi:hypothetical protein
MQSDGGAPFENLIVDFTEMPWAKGCKYLLVFICTISGWVEAFPSCTEKAWEVARCLLKEIILWYRIPVSIGLDNVRQPLWLRWYSWWLLTPQLGKVEHMNRTLKL